RIRSNVWGSRSAAAEQEIVRPWLTSQGEGVLLREHARSCDKRAVRLDRIARQLVITSGAHVSELSCVGHRSCAADYCHAVALRLRTQSTCCLGYSIVSNIVSNLVRVNIVREASNIAKPAGRIECKLL